MERLSLLESMVIAGALLAVVVAAVAWIGRDARRFAWLARFAAGFAFVVVVVGAFVRLTDAGLGCPDWPGCYGDLTPASAHHAIAQEEAAQPFGPVTMAKAWKEMFHRYIAGLLGATLVALAVAAWRARAAWQRSPWLPTAVVGVVMLQGAFGAWTVTLLLKPAIVTGHLIGGMLTLSMLAWVALSAGPQPRFAAPERLTALRPLAFAALAVVVVQIMLGGWTSTNYAALACTDWPSCQGVAVPPMQFGDAFHLLRPLGTTADGAALPFEALTAIHWTHRSFAYLALAIGLAFAWRLRRAPELRAYGNALMLLLCVQAGLGISNVLLQLPLPVAVAHNAGAALTLLCLVAIHQRLALAARQARGLAPARNAWPRERLTA